jgi:hypothetical protein
MIFNPLFNDSTGRLPRQISWCSMMGPLSSQIRPARSSRRSGFPAIAFDAVKHLLLCAIERRPPKLDLENYPHLPIAEVALTRAVDY